MAEKRPAETSEDILKGIEEAEIENEDFEEEETETGEEEEETGEESETEASEEEEKETEEPAVDLPDGYKIIDGQLYGRLIVNGKEEWHSASKVIAFGQQGQFLEQERAKDKATGPPTEFNWEAFDKEILESIRVISSRFSVFSFDSFA